MTQADLSAYGAGVSDDGTGDPTRRSRWLQRLSELCDTLLPEMAADAPGDYPVRWDHCWRRLSYDNAVRDEWTNKIDQPFTDNADLRQIQQATTVATRIWHDNPRFAWKMQEQSLLYRGEIDPDQTDTVDGTAVLVLSR